MKQSIITSYSFLRLQSIVYFFIIVWALLIKNFQILFVVWKHIELINKILFVIYFFTVLISVVVLIKQIRSLYFNDDDDQNTLKRIWAVFNIILYYGVITADLYLASQSRL
jgi:hypothetical protein